MAIPEGFKSTLGVIKAQMTGTSPGMVLAKVTLPGVFLETAAARIAGRAWPGEP